MDFRNRIVISLCLKSNEFDLNNFKNINENLLYFIQISDFIFYFNKNNKYSRRKRTFLKI